MIIAQISDTHIALDSPDAGQRITDFERAIDDINALDPAPDVIVHTGDIVHNGLPEEYSKAAAILGEAKAPVYVMAGNKDDRANLRTAFAPAGYLDRQVEFIDYAVEDFPVRLVMLDTLCPGHNRGDFCEARLTRFAAMMERNSDKPAAVFTHHPPYEVFVGPDRFHFADLDVMESLCAEMKRYANIIALFSGHVHRGAFGRVGNIPATIMPCIATSLRRGEYPEWIKTRPVYHLHRYEPAMGFVTEARIV